MYFREPPEIPAGTSVVTKVSRRDETGWTWKKGSTGIVIQSPGDHRSPYVVEMNNGQRIPFMRDELVVRSLKVRLAIQTPKEAFDPAPYLAALTATGSVAYNLSTEGSDVDLKAIYVLPLDMLAGLYTYPEELQRHLAGEHPKSYVQGAPLTRYLGEGSDNAFYELSKFVRMALENNPTALEMLWSPLWESLHPRMDLLRENRDLFISRHMEESFSHYAKSQFDRMKRRVAKGLDYKPGHAVQLVRLLYSALHLMETGEPLLDASAHREQLLAIKRRDIDLAETTRIADSLIARFNQVSAKSDLPEAPNYDLVHDLILQIRGLA